MNPLSTGKHDADPTPEVMACIVARLKGYEQPSAAELVRLVEEEIGFAGRWYLLPAIEELLKDSSLAHSIQDYLQSMLDRGELDRALRGEDPPDRETASTIDSLLRQSRVYRSSEAFREMIEFMGRFRDYAPFNNMLVKLQNPACAFYATEKDWQERFDRNLKEDARPMLILAPMHPVMTVYDLDQTEGALLPRRLEEFTQFEGKWDPACFGQLQANAAKCGIRVDFKALSTSLAGFATTNRAADGAKMRIAIHTDLPDPSKFGVLCHELAHILLGHLGSDWDRWWPSRGNLSRTAAEIEAESVAYIVLLHVGLQGSSAAYVSGYLKDGPLPPAVSLDHIAKTAGLLKRMATESMPAKRPRLQSDKEK